jgi:hypothetical protein
MVPPDQQCGDNRRRNRSGSGVAANLRNGTPGAAFAGRISEARPQLAVPDAHQPSAYLRSGN